MRKLLPFLFILLPIISFGQFSNVACSLKPFYDNANHLWGYKDLNGNLIIESKFDEAAPFYENENRELTIVKYKNKWALINVKGNIKKKFDFDEVSLSFHSYGWLYKKENLYGFITDDGHEFTKDKYEGIWFLHRVKNDTASSNLFLYKNKTHYGYAYLHTADKKRYIGNIKIFNYDEVLYGDLSKIHIKSKNLIETWGTNEAFLDINKGLFARINNTYGLMKTTKSYDANYLEVLNFYDSVLACEAIGFIKYYRVIKNEKWGSLLGYFQIADNDYNKERYEKNMGKEVVPLKYDWLDKFNSQMAFTSIIKLNNKIGLINDWGQILVEPNYEQVVSLYPLGLYALNQNNLWGFYNILDTNNNTSIKTPLYDSCYIQRFSGKYYINVVKEKKHGLLSKSGELIFKPMFQEIKPMLPQKDKVLTKQNEKWGIHSLRNSEEIYPNSFDSIGKQDPIGNYVIKNYNKFGLVNARFKLIVGTELEQILNLNIIGQDTFYIVKMNSKWGSIDITNRDYQWYGYSLYPYSVFPQFLSVSLLNNEFEIKKQRITIEREKNRLEEQNRQEIQRVAEIKKQQEDQIRLKKEAANFEINRIQNIRKSNIWGVAVGDRYGDGKVLQIFSDGSGIQIITDLELGTLKEAEKICKNNYSRKMYMADLDELNKAFKANIFSPKYSQNSRSDAVWVVKNSTGSYGKYMTIGEKDIISFPAGYNDSRVAYLIQNGRIQDMFSDNNEDAYYHFACVKGIGKND